MAFNPTVTGIAGASDVAFDNSQDGEALVYDGAIAKWKNDSMSSKADATHQHTAAEVVDLTEWKQTNNLFSVQIYDPLTGPGPLTPGTLWIASDTAPSTPTFTLVTQNFDTTDGQSWTFVPQNSLAGYSGAEFYVWIWIGKSAGNAPMPATVSGAGLTWTAVGAGVSQPNTLVSLRMYKGVGTPTAGNIVIDTGTGNTADGCVMECVAVQNAPLVQSVYSAPATGYTDPTASFSATVGSGKKVLAGLGYNSGSQTVSVDPGTAFGGASPDITMTNPSIRARVSLVDPAVTTLNWTKSGAAQYTVGAIEVG